MKRISTNPLLIVSISFLFTINLFSQVPAGNGWNYEETAETPMIINENFQNWTKNHTSEDGTGRSTTYSTWTQDVNIIGGETLPLFDLNLCAVAPDFFQQNYYEGKDYNASLSKGYVEISRKSNNGTEADGYFLIKNIPSLAVIQFSYASIGGTKRAITLEKSTDAGETWTLVRPGEDDPTGNYQNCALGFQLEDAIMEENVMLRFSQHNGQDARIHDIRIFGRIDLTSIDETSMTNLKVIPLSEYIAVNKLATIEIYTINGQLVERKENTQKLGITNYTKGIYIARAITANEQVVEKFIVR